MGWLEGVLTGYADRHYQIQKDKMAEAQQAAEREERVFSTLLNSKYPDVRDYASAGILDLSNPRRRKGGVAGWMGDVEQTPYLGMIQRARERYTADPEAAADSLGMAKDELGGAPPTTPSIPTAAGSVAAPAPGAPSAALPATSLVTGGAPTPSTPAPAPVPIGQPLPTPTPPTPPPAPPSVLSPQLRGFQTAPASGSRFVDEPAPTGGPQAGMPPPPPQLEVAGLGAPPMPPAGPPLPVSAGPPPPPGQVGIGLSGATTQPVGAMRPVRPSRTQLPGIFPTASETAMDAARARSAGTDLGEQDSYVRVAEAQGLTRADGLQMWAEAQMKARGGVAPFQSMEIEYTDAQGGIHKTLGGYDKHQSRYLDSQGNPIPGNVTRAQPASALGMGSWANRAMNQLGVSILDVRNDPQLASQVNDLAQQLQAAASGATTTARAEAAAGAPASSVEVRNKTALYQGRWNQLQAPVRGMESYLRVMGAAYARYKAGDRTAWEPLRTAFVHVSEPNSVVMPSEFLRAGDVGSLVQRIEGYISRTAVGGAPLPDAQIDEMMRMAASIYQQMQTYNAGNRAAIESAIADLGIAPEKVFGRDIPFGEVAGPAAANAPGVSALVPPKAPAASPAAGPGDAWTMVDGVLYHNGQPFK